MSNRRDKFNDDWSEYAKRDNRKRNHDEVTFRRRIEAARLVEPVLGVVS